MRSSSGCCCYCFGFSSSTRKCVRQNKKTFTSKHMSATGRPCSRRTRRKKIAWQHTNETGFIEMDIIIEKYIVSAFYTDELLGVETTTTFHLKVMWTSFAITFLYYGSLLATALWWKIGRGLLTQCSMSVVRVVYLCWSILWASLLSYPPGNVYTFRNKYVPTSFTLFNRLQQVLNIFFLIWF